MNKISSKPSSFQSLILFVNQNFVCHQHMVKVPLSCVFSLAGSLTLKVFRHGNMEKYQLDYFFQFMWKILKAQKDLTFMHFMLHRPELNLVDYVEGISTDN